MYINVPTWWEGERGAHLHPRRLGRIQSRVERHRVLLVRRQSSAHVDDGHLQRGGHAEPAAGRAWLGRGRTPADAQVRPSHVRVDECGQVARVDAVLEVLAVHSGQIVVPLFGSLWKRTSKTFYNGREIKYFMQINASCDRQKVDRLKVCITMFNTFLY